MFGVDRGSRCMSAATAAAALLPFFLLLFSFVFLDLLMNWFCDFFGGDIGVCTLHVLTSSSAA